MFEHHYQLSCFALERVNGVHFSGMDQVVSITDGAGSIYEFTIPNSTHYEVLKKAIRRLVPSVEWCW